MDKFQFGCYRDFEDKQKMIMIKIMHKLKTWLLDPDNIKQFVYVYGDERLYEINILWEMYCPQCKINKRYKRYTDDKKCGTFATDHVKYIMCHNIHGNITIDGIGKCIGRCVDKYEFDNKSLFFGVISSYEGAGDPYYLTLLEEFGSKGRMYRNLYYNVDDTDLFMATMFKYLAIRYVADLIMKIEYVPVQETVDIFVENILDDKYDKDNAFDIVDIFNHFKEYGMELPYDELVCNELFVNICKENLTIAPKNICDIIARSTNDNVSFLKVAIENKCRYKSRTIKLAQKHENIECARYMKKHIGDKK